MIVLYSIRSAISIFDDIVLCCRVRHPKCTGSKLANTFELNVIYVKRFVMDSLFGRTTALRRKRRTRPCVAPHMTKHINTNKTPTLFDDKNNNNNPVREDMVSKPTRSFSKTARLRKMQSSKNSKELFCDIVVNRIMRCMTWHGRKDGWNGLAKELELSPK